MVRQGAWNACNKARRAVLTQTAEKGDKSASMQGCRGLDQIWKCAPGASRRSRSEPSRFHLRSRVTPGLGALRQTRLITTDLDPINLLHVVK